MTEEAALVNEASGGAFRDAKRKREVETTWKPKGRSVRELEERSEGEEKNRVSFKGGPGRRRWTRVKGWKPDQLYRIKFI